MDKLFKTFFLVLILFTSALQAAFEPKGIGVAYLAAGGTGRAADLQPFAVYFNPALLTQVQNNDVNLFYKNYYQLEDLNLVALEARFLPFGIPVGIGVSRYGNALYQEADVRLGSAMRFLDLVDLGFSLNLYSVYLKDAGNSASAGFSVAATWVMYRNVSAAVVMDNLNEPSLSNSGEKIPLQMAAGLRWKVIPEMDLLMDLIKEEDFDFDFRAGINYKLESWFILYAGFRSLTPVYSAGFSTAIGAFRLGYAFEYHVQLSGSHSIGAGYVF